MRLFDGKINNYEFAIWSAPLDNYGYADWAVARYQLDREYDDGEDR